MTTSISSEAQKNHGREYGKEDSKKIKKEIQEIKITSPSIFIYILKHD